MYYSKSRYILFLASFFPQISWWFLLSDDKSSQVSRTLLSIGADLITIVVRMVSSNHNDNDNYIFFSLESFTPALPDVFFYWSLSDGKSPQVSVTLLSFLTDFNNAVVWMVSTCPLIYKYSTPFTYLKETVPSAPTTIVITITLMFHILFSPLARSKYLSLFQLSFIVTLWSSETVKSTIRRVHFFVDNHYRLAKIKWPVSIW